MYDIIIIGGGPAGMTAALYALRNNKSVFIIEKTGFGGQITHSPKVENFPGSMSMSGNEFADKFLEQILAQGAEVELETVTGLNKDGKLWRITTEEGGDYEARAVIIATGVKHRMLGIDGEYDLVGNGISFCAVCDGEFYRGQTVVVAGGGNSALQEAILLSENCKEVIVVQDMDHFTGEERLCEILFARPNVRSITGTVIKDFISNDGELKGLKLKNSASGEESELMCDGLFVAIGLIPENEIFSGLIPLNEFGYIASGEDCTTPENGIFVAGDCREKQIRQLTTAAADGSVSAIAACRYIDRNF